ncbi:MAG TPA: penicillin acylase family protein, partial [Candidatus Omnitrophota bacterium]|nr:penicillin acylase family protein [Candidatus Omnitrophota bacterium]
VLDAWDGSYGTRSVGAAAFERLLGRLYDFAHGDCGMTAYWASWNPPALLTRRMARAAPAELAQVLARAADDVAETSPAWGELHRLRLNHALGMLPGMEHLCRFGDLPAPGGNDTVNKTAHGIAGDHRHAIRFGANARFLADLADPDATRVVLLGGQDGWPGSATFLDQLDLWRAGEAIPLPLRPETVRATFPHRTILRP